MLNAECDKYNRSVSILAVKSIGAAPYLYLSIVFPPSV